MWTSNPTRHIRTVRSGWLHLFVFLRLHEATHETELGALLLVLVT